MRMKQEIFLVTVAFYLFLHYHFYVCPQNSFTDFIRKHVKIQPMSNNFTQGNLEVSQKKNVDSNIIGPERYQELLKRMALESGGEKDNNSIDGIISEQAQKSDSRTRESMDSLLAVPKILNEKEKKLKEIHDFIFNSLDKIKNSGNCDEKKIIRCHASVVSGFGSLVHRYVICLHIALALNRIFFIEQKQFSSFGGLPSFVELEEGRCSYLKNSLSSITNRCDFSNPECYNDNYSYEINNDYKLLEFTREADFPAPKYIPGTLPKNIETRLMVLGIDNPWHWFTSQLIGYLLTPNKKLQQKLNSHIQNIDFNRPVIGVHIRHGKDKETESKPVLVETYLENVDQLSTEYYPDQSVGLLIATDNLQSYTKMQEMAGNRYNVMLSPVDKDTSIALTRNDNDERVVENILIDFYLLTLCDISIVTYTSNVGRVIWELKTSQYPYHTTYQVVSLDGVLFYTWYAYSAGASYYLARQDNFEQMSTVNGHNITKFNKGTLFESHHARSITLSNGNTVEAYFATRRNFKPGDNVPRTKGYVLKEHLVQWPGNTKYLIDMPFK